MARDKRKKSNKKHQDEYSKRSDKNLLPPSSSSSDSSFKSFLKKRAPIYLGLVALFLIFVIPELTKGSIDDVLPVLEADDQIVLDALMSYNGPDETGYTIKEAISQLVTEELGDRVFSEKETTIDIVIYDTSNNTPSNTPSNVSSNTYNVTMNINSKDGNQEYFWIVNTDSGKITSDNVKSKYIIDLVNFYD